MLYHSTRNKDQFVEPCQAVLKGLAEDGGLFVPAALPQVDFESWQGLSYQEIARKISGMFFSDLAPDTLDEICQSAYGSQFDHEEIVPSHWFRPDLAFLELWHGPTLAFKDLALQFLPRLMQAARAKLGLKDKVLILTATSGDTGKAAMEGFAGLEDYQVLVFYPYKGVSSFQKRQMLTRSATNVRAVAVKGNFDDCQRGVKTIFADSDFKAQAKSRGYVLSSANSINIGRLVPQIVYYVYSYLRAVRMGRFSYGDPVKVIVPTGNFGNILAADYAKTMGLPLGQIQLAANQNNVLYDFLQTGTYNANRDLVKSSSPSMDILRASNLERYLYLQKPDPDWIKSLMVDLEQKGCFKVEPDLLDIKATWAGETATDQAIAEVYREGDYLIDPHTAVAYAGLKAYPSQGSTFIAATASPYKFCGKLLSALGQKAVSDDQTALNRLAALARQDLPNRIQQLWELDPDRELVIEAAEQADFILDGLAGSGFC